MAGQTPLMLACKAKDEEAVERILKELGDTLTDNINHQDMDGRTAFYYAVHYRHERIAIRLIDHGADVSLTGIGEYLPLTQAIHRRLDVVAKRIIQEVSQDYINTLMGSTHTMLLSAILFERTEVALCLIDHGADVKFVRRDGWTPLMVATKLGLYVVVERILKELGDTVFDYINLKTKKFGETALYYACFKEHVDIVRLLLQHGADPRISWQPKLMLGNCFQSIMKRAMDEPHRSSMSST